MNQTANWLKSAAILLPLAALAACGSASRDAPPGPGPGFGPGVGYPVHAATARSLTEGASPEEMTEADIRRTIRQRTSRESADVLLATQTIVDGAADLTTTCPGSSGARECDIIGVTSAAVAPFAASLNFVLSLNQNQPILGNHDSFGFSAQPVMQKHGVTLFQSISHGRRGGITESYITYAGWITDNPAGSVFGFRALHLQENPITQENPQTAVLGTGFSAGKESAANPRGIGSASWQGVMVGGMRNGNDFIQGDVRLDINELRAPNVDVAFTNIKNLNNGADIAAMEWTNIAISNGKFMSSANGRITLQGTFYGDNHEEVGGIFDRDRFVGGFGASRLPTSGPGDPSGSDFPVNAATALTRAGGTAIEESLTPAQIDAALRQIAARGVADTLISTDVDISINSVGNSANLTANCNGRNCTARHVLPGQSDLQWSLDDPLLGNFPGYAFDAQTVMQKNAVTLAQSVSTSRPEPGLTDTRLAYVGWLQQSAFYFGATRSYTNDGTVVLSTGSSFGDASGNRPRGLGSAVWSGVMLGGLVDTTAIVQGDATITLDLRSANVDVNFTGITNLNTGATITGPAMFWNNVPVNTTGRFTSNLGSLQGSFYGDDYSEVGGTFDRNNIVGAFGARLTDGADGSFYAIVNADHARNIAGGSAITLSDIAATLAARAESAGILLASDVVTEDAAGTPATHPTNCTGAACRAQGTGFRVDFSLRELLDFYRNDNPATQAVMTRNGINTVQTAFAPSTSEARLAYGAWLDDSAFAVQITRRAAGAIERAGLSFGEASDSNPGGTGSAIWNGLMLASATGSNAIVQGDATIDVDDLANPDVDVIFRNLVNLNGPAGLPPYHTNGVPLTISWDNLALTNGGFSHVSSDSGSEIRIRGNFYGAVHDEVGGTFNYNTANFDFVGAFGARRGDMDLGSADYPVHAASARRIAGGSAAPELTSTEISTTFGQRTSQADTILASNIIANNINRSTADCTSATCRIVANARPLSLGDPFLGNPPDYNFSAQAVMIKNTVTMAQSVSRGTTQNRTETHISYGGWLDQSAFGIRRTRLQTGEATAGLSIGMASRSNPAGTGTAQWDGIMVGSMVSNRNIVQGDAMLTMNLDAVTVDVEFDNIKNLNTGAEIATMRWTNIAVTNGNFTTNSGNLAGRFYTADYSEVGGTFDNNQIVGAFGAKRLQDGDEGTLYAVVNANHARTVINAQSPTVRAANIAPTIGERAINATTLLVSDVVSEIPATAALNTYITNCTGRSCAASSDEFRAEFSLDNPVLGNHAGYRFNTQAVMLQNGLNTIQAAAVGESDSTIPETLLTYGAWLDESAFAVRITRYGQSNVRGSNAIDRAGLSFGVAPSGNPGGVGSAAWTGLMVGSATTGTDIVQGDAHIDVDDLSNPDVDVAFRNIFNLNGPAAVPPYNVNGVPLTISWDNLPVAGGQFAHGGQNDSIRIRGSFYGANHEEVGGTFNYATANFDLVGAFGGRRGAVDSSSPSGTDYPVHAASARSLVAGDTPPILGSSGVDAAVRQRTTPADTLLASNITANSNNQLTFDCSNATCTIVANTRPLSLNNPLLGNFPEYSFSAQPVMVKNAVTLAQSVSRGANPSGIAESHITYTGWLDQSIFGIRRTRLQNSDATAGFSIGNDSASNPGGTGEAVWRGIMTGSQSSNANVIQGDAMLTLDLDAVNVDITFDQIKNLNTGADVNAMTWAGLTLTDGKFNSANSNLRGSFYTADYSEVGGTFERNNIVGAFGARRLADGVDGALYAVVNAQHARAIIGATAATTSANIATTIGNRASSADILLASDVVAETLITEPVTHLTNCTGRTCAASSNNFRAEFSLNDMLLGNLQGYDFNTQAVMLHNGINTVQAASVGTPRTRIPQTRLTYGAWLDNSAFAVNITRHGESGAAGSAIERAGLSFGEASIGSPGGTGSAVWTGVMLGSAINSTAMVQGDAHIDVDDLGNPDVDVAFRNIFNLNGSAAVPPYNINGIPLTISWDNLPVTDGQFSHGGEEASIRLRGSFYGANHEEVGGTFNYNTADFGFVGAFGGQRRAVVDPSNPGGTDYPVHAGSSLTIIGGEAAPRLSSSAVAAAVNQRAVTADTLLASNITVNGSNQLTADCTAAACTIVSNTRPLSLTDPLLGNFANYDFSAQSVMRRNGVTLAQAVSRGSDESHITYGGWLDQSLFGIRTTRLQNGAAATAGLSVGNDSASNPAGTGAAVWSGVMVGSQTNGSNVVQGDATLTLDLDAVNVDVEFTDIKNLNTGADVASMSWQDLSVTNGTFNSANSNLRGSFYTADYSEVGGTFERSNIVGAFGARRLADDEHGALYAVVNATHARTVINAAAATVNDNIIATEIGNRAGGADALVVSDVVAETVATGTANTYRTVCSGQECSAQGEEFLSEFSLDGVLLGNFQGYNFNTQAVMLQNTINTVQTAAVGTPRSTIPETHLAYGAWLDESVFAVRITRYGESGVRGSNAIERAGMSFGAASGGNPGGAGSATWTGLMVGSEINSTAIVQGDAHIDVDDLGNPDVDVAFRNIFNLNGPVGVPPYNVNGIPLTISWNNLEVADGAFTHIDEDNRNIRIRGSFYGATHDEVGGTFNYETDRFGLVGAFGGKRGIAGPSDPSGTDYPVHAASARVLTGGTTPPRLGASGVDAAIRQRIAAGVADTLLSSAVAVDGGSDLTSSCTGRDCTATGTLAGQNVTRSLSLDDPLLGNAPGYSFSAQPVMLRNGVTLAQAVSRGTTQSGAREIYITYGGWLDGSVFGVRMLRVQPQGSQNTSVLRSGWSAGNDSGSNPGGTGLAAWSGVMVGGQRSGGNMVQGDATLTLDLNAAQIDVNFTDIKNLNTGADITAMSWNNVAVTAGAFTSSVGALQGSFYGEGYEEVGGTFDRNNIVGSFGARRLTRGADVPDGSLYPIINAAHARTIVGGTALSPTLSAADITTGIQNRAAAANRLFASDVAATDTANSSNRHETTCAGRECASKSAAFRVEFSLDEPLLGNRPGYSFNTAAVMQKSDITTLQAAAVGISPSKIPSTQLTYGGWLDNSAFAVQTIRYRNSDPEGTDAIERVGLSFGLVSGSNPSGIGAATWQGVMVGSRKDNTDIVQGDARVDIDDLSNPDVDVVLNNIFDLNAAANAPAYNINGEPLSISWDNLPVANGRFAHVAGDSGDALYIQMRGSFYAADYSEVGGVFDYTNEQDNISLVGAFGAKRVSSSGLSGLDYPVNAVSARIIAGGSAAPTLAATEISTEIARRATPADTLLASTLAVSGGADLTNNCTGRSCTATGTVAGDSNFSLTLTLDNPLFGNRPGHNFNAQPVMTKNGVIITQAVSRGSPQTGETDTRLTYAGWLDESAFGVQIIRLQDSQSTAVLGAGFSFGNDSGRNPAGTGAAAWSGIMVGSPKNSQNIVQGDANIDIDNLANPNVDVQFANIKNLNTGADVAAMSWDDISISNGTFTSSAGGAIRGTFYGAEYQEVGGIFDRNNIVGGFGARRMATALAYPVNAASARSFAGGSAATITAEEVDAAVRQSTRSADRLLATNADIAGGANLTTSCSGKTCTASGTLSGDPNFTLGLSTDNLSLANLPGAVFNAQPVMVKNTVTLAQTINRVTTATTTTTHATYGGWLQGSAFGVQTTSLQNNQGTGTLRTAWSAGHDTGGNPAGTGEAVWSGVMTGSVKTNGNIVQGDAMLTLDMNAANVDVDFTSIKNLNSGADVNAISWDNISVSNGGFTSSVGALQGSFYGDEYEQAGGVFDQNGITGAFGARRLTRAEGAPAGTFYAVLDDAKARTIAGGTAASSTITASNIPTTFAARITAADKLLASDVFATSAAGANDQHTTVCAGETCTATNENFQDFRLELSLDDPLLGNRTNYTFNAQPVMTKNTINTIQAASFGTPASTIPETYLTYGAWLDDSAFAVQTIRYQQSDPAGNDAIERFGMSFGNDSGSKPGGSGSATWNGLMVGVTQTGTDIVQGDATVDIDDLGAEIPLVDVVFQNIFNLNGSPDSAPYNIDGEPLTISWDDIPLTVTGTDNAGNPTFDGTFATQSDEEDDPGFSDYGSVQGTFYGTTHDEVGGVFDHTPSGITGAFGAQK